MELSEILVRTLGILVTFMVVVGIHEWGHFWVARRCGVRVERFSLGMGPVVWTRRDRQGTEFCLSALPIGGYVKMLGEQDDEPIPESLKPYAFSSMAPSRRIAIALAGPVANFLLALIIYYGYFLAGETVLAPIVGSVEPGSPAAEAGLKPGDEIVAIDGKPIKRWQDVNFSLISRIGESGQLHLVVITENRFERTRTIPLERWLSDYDASQSPAALLGFAPIQRPFPAVVARVEPGGPADRAGLQKGDKILQADDRMITDWFQWRDYIQANPGKAIQLKVARGDEILERVVVPDTVTRQGQSYGIVGLVGEPGPWPPGALREIHYNVFSAWGAAVGKLYDQVAMSLQGIGKLVSGAIGLNNLSGPITIAKVAGESASYGWLPFMMFMAFISLSLGVINLLPVPVLDGGHVVMHGYELVTGRPLSEQVQAVMMKAGLLFILGLASLAIFNDIARF